jgi:hypothetical protein
MNGGIGVDNKKQFTCGIACAMVDCRALSRSLLMVKHFQSGIDLLQFSEALRRVVGRSIIDDNDIFNSISENAPNGVSQNVRAIERWDNS